MSAANTDLINKATSRFSTTITAGIGSSDTTIPLSSVSRLPTDTAIILTLDATDAAGNATPTKLESVLGVIIGTNLTSVIRGLEGVAQSHNSGAVVVDYVTAAHHNRFAQAFLAYHSQAGAALANFPITSPNITTGINDVNGNAILAFNPIASAVNELQASNAITGSGPILAALGSDANIDLTINPKGTGSIKTNGTKLLGGYDYVVSGLVWSITSGLVGAMTGGSVVIGGRVLTVAAVASHTFTASKDTYIDILDAGNGTGTVVYTEVATNAASPALAANSLRIAIQPSLVALGTFNQGQESAVLPIASSVPYQVTDSLGNLIANATPWPSVIGYHERSTDFTQNPTVANTLYDIPELAVPFIAPGNRKVEVEFWFKDIYGNSASMVMSAYIREGATTLTQGAVDCNGSNLRYQPSCKYETTPTAGLHTYKASVSWSAVVAGVMECNSTSKMYLKVKLV